MNKLEAMKKHVELAKVKAAKMEMEVRILEKQEEIERLEVNIANQEAAIMKIEAELKGDN